MGWRELIGWLESMERERKGPEPDPGSWKNTDRDPWWAEMRAQRDDERR